LVTRLLIEILDDLQDDGLVGTDDLLELVDCSYYFLVAPAIAEDHDVASCAINQFIVSGLDIGHDIGVVSVESAHDDGGEAVEYNLDQAVMREPAVEGVLWEL
jgi:hypothetical protein